MKSIPALFSTLFLLSCWKYNGHQYSSNQKVWGNKPVYAAKTEVQKIVYDPNKHAYQIPGNIYVFRNFIFQVDVGHGIHVIDNSVPVHADRIGFITLAGCQQISIKGSYLYTNSFKDLVTLDITDPAQIRVVSRIADAFPTFYSEPAESGYYTCPEEGDSVVIYWVKDSIYFSCYKN